MPLELIKSSLESRTIRKAIVSTGIRILKAQDVNQDTKDDQGNIISTIFNWGKRLVGFIISSLKSMISWSASAIWGLIVSTSQFIWHFNWNATDEQLDQQVQNTWNTTAGLVGGLVGQIAGWITCGVLPGAVTFVFNEVAGAYILKQLGEQMAQEIAASAANVIRQAFRATAQTLIVWAYKNVRKLIRSNSQFIGQIFGSNY